MVQINLQLYPVYSLWNRRKTLTGSPDPTCMLTVQSYMYPYSYINLASAHCCALLVNEPLHIKLLIPMSFFLTTLCISTFEILWSVSTLLEVLFCWQPEAVVSLPHMSPSRNSIPVPRHQYQFLGNRKISDLTIRSCYTCLCFKYLLHFAM